MGAIIRAILFALLFVSPSPANELPKVDLLLVLASDVSRSIGTGSFQLQRKGYAAALTDPDVVAVMTAGRHKRIAISYVEWSGVLQHRVVAPWMLIDSHAAAHLFTIALHEEQRSYSGMTAIGSAINFAVRVMDHAPYASERKKIDVSGDGTNNEGPDVRWMRDYAVSKGIVINGLVIFNERPIAWNIEHTNPPGGLDKYYRDHVIGGEGSFVMAAKDFRSFGDAVRKKLIAEIAMR